MPVMSQTAVDNTHAFSTGRLRVRDDSHLPKAILAAPPAGTPANRVFLWAAIAKLTAVVFVDAWLHAESDDPADVALGMLERVLVRFPGVVTVCTLINVEWLLLDHGGFFFMASPA